jgi:hypothetical protein
MPRDDGVGAHPHGGDTVEAPGSPAGEQRKCRGVGAGPASRPLLLAELLPPPGGRADAQSRGRARRGGPAPMRRKEKRLLQAVALALAALVLLPNVGLWALYRERQPDGSPGGLGAAVAPAAVQVSSLRPRVGSTLSPTSLPPCSSLFYLSFVSALRHPILGMATSRLREGQRFIQALAPA